MNNRQRLSTRHCYGSNAEKLVFTLDVIRSRGDKKNGIWTWNKFYSRIELDSQPTAQLFSSPRPESTTSPEDDNTSSGTRRRPLAILPAGPVSYNELPDPYRTLLIHAASADAPHPRPPPTILYYQPTNPLVLGNQIEDEFLYWAPIQMDDSGPQHLALAVNMETMRRSDSLFRSNRIKYPIFIINDSRTAVLEWVIPRCDEPPHLDAPTETHFRAERGEGSASIDEDIHHVEADISTSTTTTTSTFPSSTTRNSRIDCSLTLDFDSDFDFELDFSYDQDPDSTSRSSTVFELRRPSTGSTPHLRVAQSTEMTAADLLVDAPVHRPELPPTPKPMPKPKSKPASAPALTPQSQPTPTEPQLTRIIQGKRSYQQPTTSTPLPKSATPLLPISMTPPLSKSAAPPTLLMAATVTPTPSPPNPSTSTSTCTLTSRPNSPPFIPPPTPQRPTSLSTARAPSLMPTPKTTLKQLVFTSKSHGHVRHLLTLGSIRRAGSTVSANDPSNLYVRSYETSKLAAYYVSARILKGDPDRMAAAETVLPMMSTTIDGAEELFIPLPSASKQFKRLYKTFSKWIADPNKNANYWTPHSTYPFLCWTRGRVPILVHEDVLTILNGIISANKAD